MKRCLIFAMVLASWISPSRGATLERLSLDDMINRSSMIVMGKVTASWSLTRAILAA